MAAITDYVDVGLYNLHPDIKSAVDQAVAGGWTPQRFENELRKSSWWRARADAQRKWETLVATNPQEAQRQTDQMRSQVSDLAAQAGVTLDAAGLASLTTAMVTYGWTKDEANNWLAAKYQYKPGVQTGTASQVEDSLRQYQFEYGVPMTDAARTSFTQKVISGEWTTEQFRDYMVEQAKTQFPSIADALDQGITVRQYYSPYIQTAVKELGVNEAEIDLTDPMWNAAIRQPVEGGGQTAMNLDDWRKKIRTDAQYGWQYTDGAREQAAKSASSLAQMFGSRG